MKKHILIIDDEAPIRDLLGQALTRQCYRISVAASGAEAIRKFAEDPPNLMIVDLQLDDADGLELIGQFKQKMPHIPCILLTGVIFDPEVICGDLLCNVACYLEKTIPLQQLVSEVRRLVGAAC
jgi:DNA-binding NtrC family response regulator